MRIIDNILRRVWYMDPKSWQSIQDYQYSYVRIHNPIMKKIVQWLIKLLLNVLLLEGTISEAESMILYLYITDPGRDHPFYHEL